jgi:hypothetical protein
MKDKTRNPAINEEQVDQARKTFSECPIGEHNYLFISYHHNNSLIDKSNWTIPAMDEANLFYEAANFAFNSTSCEFIDGIVSDLGDLMPTGVSSKDSQGGEHALYLAKFTGGKNWGHTFHGYPADYVLKSEDRPDKATLEMLSSQNLKKSYRRKILKAKPI